MEDSPIKYHAIICTRNPELKTVTTNLLSYLDRVGINIKLLVGKKSIFGAYEEGVNLIVSENGTPHDDDIFIFCHDDIEIYNDPEHFKSVLRLYSWADNAGFMGVAGTSLLTLNAVWWDKGVWAQGGHKGYVLHGTPGDHHATYFGDHGQVVVLDGVFLAAKYKCLKEITLSKPPSFQGLWDFYDLQYTLSAHKKGFINRAVPIFIRHESMGELQGRTSWELNRQAFIAANKLPVSVNDRN